MLDFAGVLDQVEEAVGAAAAGDRVLVEVGDVRGNATPRPMSSASRNGSRYLSPRP